MPKLIARYGDGDPNYPLLRGVEITTLILATLFVTARLVNRTIRKKLAIADAVILLAWALGFTITVLELQALTVGFGKLDSSLSHEQHNKVNQLLMTVFVAFPACYALIRVSIILTYLRVFPAQTNKYFCWALCLAQFIFATWSGLTVLLQCNPIKAYWDNTVKGKCINPQPQDIAIIALNASFDLVVYLWPAHYLYKLNLPWSRRVGLICMFSVGIVNVALSLTRLSIILVMYRTKQYVHYGIRGDVIILLEAHVGLMCASLPYLRFVFEFFNAHFFSHITSQLQGRSWTRTKSNPPSRQTDNQHPFEELNEEGRPTQPSTPNKDPMQISTFTDSMLGSTVAGEETQIRDGRVWVRREPVVLQRR